MSATRSRLIHAAASLVLVLVALGWQWPVFAGRAHATVGIRDFVAYWSASSLLRVGDDPYDATAIMALEQQAGWTHERAQLVFNPPHLFVLNLPLSLLSFDKASVLWLALQIQIVFLCGITLGRLYELPHEIIGAVLGFAYIPTLGALKIGQISTLLLAGIVLFLWAQRGRQDWIAGAALSLLTVKPHVTYLLLSAALLWALRTRRWRLVSAFCASIAAGVLFSVALRPSVLMDYVKVVLNPPYEWRTPTLGHWLRVAFGWDQSWMQLVPSLVGVTVLLVSYARNKARVVWTQQAPTLLLASVITAGYGWSFDQMVLVPVLVAAAASTRAYRDRRSIAVLLLFAAAQALMLWQNRLGIEDHYSYWHAPVLGVCYWLSQRRAGYGVPAPSVRPGVSG